MAHKFLKHLTNLMPRNNHSSGCLRCLFISRPSASTSSRSRSYSSSSSSSLSHLTDKLRKDSIVLNCNCHGVSRNFHKSSSFWHNGETKTKCWKCGGDTNPQTELFFCDCGVVQKPANVTYFQLLQMKQSFDIDLKSLGQIYRNMQSRLHPDKFSTKSQQEQAFAEEQSALLNKAYSCLLKPLSRAIYLLELQNISIEENDTYSDPEFLMDVMTFNEKISEATTPEDINQLYDSNEEKVDECIKKISKAFQDEDITNARIYTIKLRYFMTIQERIKELRMKNFG